MPFILTPAPLFARLNAFKELGRILATLSAEETDRLARQAAQENPWFTPTTISLAITHLTIMLEEDGLDAFVNAYPALHEPRAVKRIGVVMAGNIPGVGFHDALCVLLTGHLLLAKLSKSDTVFMQFLFHKLVEIAPFFQPFIQVEERLKEMDAVICTGSNNTARYFEQYFGQYPHIIRKNRTSVAVLDGNETAEELQQLGKDIFTYFGLGCRNVSKLFLPYSFPIEKVIDQFEGFSEVINQHKYANNYTYNRAIYLLNQDPFLDNGFLLLKESDELHSPLSVLLYEKYTDKAVLMEKLNAQENELQCIVTHMPEFDKGLAFGEAQCPLLSDFADGVDTLKFLLSL